MANLFRRHKNVPPGPRANAAAAPNGGPTVAATLATAAALDAALTDELARRSDEPHSDSLAALRRRHELVRAARLMLAHAESGQSLLGLLMDFREFALNSHR
jgi:hypothetical protein